MTNSEREVELLGVLHELDVVRGQRDVLKARDGELDAQAVQLMRKLGCEQYVFAQRCAALVIARNRTIDPGRFLAAALRAGIDEAEARAALKTTVNLGAAKKLVGDDVLTRISVFSDAAPHIRISGAGARQPAIAADTEND